MTDFLRHALDTVGLNSRDSLQQELQGSVHVCLVCMGMLFMCVCRYVSACTFMFRQMYHTYRCVRFLLPKCVCVCAQSLNIRHEIY